MFPARYFWLTSGILAATLGVSAFADQRGSQVLTEPLANLPSMVAGWGGAKELALDPRAVERLKATSFLSREYSNGTNRLGLFVAYYANQSAGGYMHSPKVCLPGSGWEIDEPGSIRVASPDGGTVPINRYIISNAGQRALILYWYQSSDRIVADEYWTKLYLIHDGLFYGRAGGAIARIQLPVDALAEANGVRFASQLMVEMRRILGG